MDEPTITCDRVDALELDTRYLAGTLTDEEAEAFEAHYFGCDRCWGLVRQGSEIRAAGADAVAGPARAAGARRWTRWSWIPLAAAAAALLWVATGDRGGIATDPGDTVRGDGDSLMVRSESDPAGIAAAWRAVPAASTYLVRLFEADGTLRWERRLKDTTVSIARDSLPGASGALFWQVQALDPVGATLVRSALIEVTAAPGR
ncbi:MAG: zf-HC2 domain-containing protein [Gemmatimonadales bacterium]